MPRAKNRTVFVALLRGINVGGKNLVPMKALAEVFTDVGCVDPKTYIQSGNVVFTAPSTLAPRLPDLLSARAEARFGVRIPVQLRTARELEAVVQGSPFVAEGVEAKALHVLFLRDAPTRAQVSALDPTRSPPDRFSVRGREVYLSCPNGVARTKLTNAYFDSKLETSSTVRNWRTVVTLLGLATALE